MATHNDPQFLGNQEQVSVPSNKDISNPPKISQKSSISDTDIHYTPAQDKLQHDKQLQSTEYR